MANLRVDKITSTETFETTGSVQFDGTGDRLTLNNSNFVFGTLDFTVELFVYKPNTDQEIFFSQLSNSATGRDGIALGYQSAKLWILQGNGSSWDLETTVGSFPTSTWVHIAVSRDYSASKTYYFIDGKLVYTYTESVDLTAANSGDIVIGNAGTTTDTYSFTGHISNLRVLKNKALYTKNFKPSMKELEVTPDTVLLACQSKTDASLEKTGKTITVTGNAVASELTPGILTPVPKAGAGSAITGSIVFDGGDDYLSIPDSDDFYFEDHKFTIELWAYTGTDTTDNRTLFSQWAGGSDRNFQFDLRGDASKVWRFYYRTSNPGGGTEFVSGNDPVEPNSWYHIAAVADGTNLKLYVNGILQETNAISGNANNSSQALIIGAYSTSPQYYYDGYISNLRIVKGTALYTDDFIPPTRELKKVPGTVLLCCQDENSVTTEATGKTITAYGDITASNFTPQVGDDRKVTFEGVTKINSDAYFYLPTGDTVTRDSRSGRGVFGGGNPGTANNTMQYVQIQSQGNALDFGDLTVARQASGLGSATRGVFGGNAHPNGDTMDFITIASTGNAIDFGNLQSSLNGRASAASSTRGIFAGGGTPTVSNVIDFITIASTGNATNFGDLTAARRNHAGVASPIRAVFAGGDAGPTTDTIDFVTIASTGNAVDFGNLSAARETAGGASSSTRGVFMGGYTSPGDVDVIEYITIASKGDATDFGNLSAARRNGGSVSNNIRGLYAGGHPSVNTIEFVTIASTGNADDFGDLLVGQRINPNHVSDSHGGLG